MALTHNIVAFGRSVSLHHLRRLNIICIAIFIANIGGHPLWGQSSWQYGTGTISASTGARVILGTTSAGPTTLGVTQQSGDTVALSLRRSGANPIFQFCDPGTTCTYVEMDHNSGNLLLGTNGAGGNSTVVIQGNAGNVGIGTTLAPQYKLSVNGTIGTKEVVVTNTGWADYVFKPDYQPMPLNELSSYIQEHHHLPGIPSEAEVQEKGVGLGDLQVKLLAKIEELTLHMIQTEAKTKRLEEDNRELQERLLRIEGGHQ